MRIDINHNGKDILRREGAEEAAEVGLELAVLRAHLAVLAEAAVWRVRAVTAHDAGLELPERPEHVLVYINKYEP
jgi:hypothetical protein